MARIANNGRKQNKWEPPPKDIYVLRTPNKHPMRMPIDFKKPRTPGRQPAADRYTIYCIYTLKFLLYQFKIQPRFLNAYTNAILISILFQGICYEVSKLGL